MDEKIFYVQFGKYLKINRIIHNLTQIDIAKRINTSQRVISSVENGNPSQPSKRRAIEEVLNELGVPSFSEWLKTNAAE